MLVRCRGREVLVLRAPDGFRFQPSCGYWVVERIGTEHVGLPQGSSCSASADLQVRVPITT